MSRHESHATAMSPAGRERIECGGAAPGERIRAKEAEYLEWNAVMRGRQESGRRYQRDPCPHFMKTVTTAVVSS
jgi:hypothetical protein